MEGIDLESSRGIAVTPQELLDSTSVEIINVTEIGTPSISVRTTNSSSSITIKWTNVLNAVNYYVYRSTSPTGTYTLVTSTTKTSYTNTGLASGTSYYYKIRAYYSSEYSDYSAYATETTSS